jgi:hypothetical protein
MIPNHEQFIEAIKEQKKVRVQFYSQPDSGVLDRVCAPLEYGPGGGSKDGLNLYWLWDYAGDTGSYRLGLVPQQIVDLQVLGEVFDPAQLTSKPAPELVAPTGVMPAATTAAAGGAPSPKL